MSDLHDIAARLDRLPSHSTWHAKIAAILGTVVFCDCFIQYVGSSMLTDLLKSGWSTLELNTLSISLTMLGYAIGSFVGGVVADRYGRRKGLIGSTAVFTTFVFVAAASPSMECLIACRLGMGVGLGAALTISYGCLPEYTPSRARGYYAGLVGLIGNFSPPLGCFCVVVLTPIVGWRVIYVLLGVMGLIALVSTVRFFSESPRWLASCGKAAEADDVVSGIEKSFLKEGISLSRIRCYTATREERANFTVVTLLKRPFRRRLIVVSCALFTMNMLVYTVTNWTPAILAMQGWDTSLSLGVTGVILLGAPFGILLLVVFADKHGRKLGLIVGLVILAVLSAVWSVTPLSLTPEVVLLGFVLCACLYYYALLVCSVYVGELFPTEIRMTGVGISNAIGRTASILSPYLVVSVLDSFGLGAVYIGCSVACLVTALVVGLLGIETRYRPLEDIS